MGGWDVIVGMVVDIRYLRVDYDAIVVQYVLRVCVVVCAVEEVVGELRVGVQVRVAVGVVDAIQVGQWRASIGDVAVVICHLTFGICHLLKGVLGSVWQREVLEEVVLRLLRLRVFYVWLLLLLLLLLWLLFVGERWRVKFVLHDVCDSTL